MLSIGGGRFAASIVCTQVADARAAFGLFLTRLRKATNCNYCSNACESLISDLGQLNRTCSTFNARFGVRVGSDLHKLIITLLTANAVKICWILLIGIPVRSIEHSRLPHAAPQASSKPIVRLDSVNLKSQI